jgi:peptide methionine sulfoxide reductase msrA/msrB
MTTHRMFQSLLLILSLSFLLTACAKEKPVAETRKTLPPAANAQLDSIVLGMGCFWGAEKRMSEIPGVVDVESGYANGDIPGTYEAVLDHERAVRRGRSDKRNHAEVVKVTYDPAQTTLETVLIKFWESHDPTQGDRQGNDVGSNYRSAVYTHSPAQLAVADKTRAAYQQALTQAGRGGITTEVAPENLLFRRGLPSGLSGEEPQRLLRTGRHRREVSGTAKSPGQRTGGSAPRLDGKALNLQRQLVVFEAEDCAFCKQFKAEVLDHWKTDVPVVRTLNPRPRPAGRWKRRCSRRRPSCCSRRARRSPASPVITAKRRASGSGWASGC